MQIRRDPHHLIDVLFPAALLFVFAFSAVSVILLATGVYRDTAIHSSRSYTAETALAYLTEKVHQNDADGQIDIGTFDGARLFRSGSLMGIRTILLISTPMKTPCGSCL